LQKKHISSPRVRGRKRARLAGGIPQPSSKGDATRLAFQELEVPVRPLLRVDEERTCGGRIRACLRRLAALLPRHPEGYRRFIARMGQVVSGGSPMFSWFPMAQRIEADLTMATAALERAEMAAPARPERAARSFEDGVRTIVKYRLDPETLYLWAREVGGSLHNARPLDRLPRFLKVDRIVRRIVRVLEAQRDRLVLPNFRLVLKEVFRYRPVGMVRGDLFQEGILGLHKAVFRYDPERGTRFSTYATFWIRQSMRKCLTDRSRLIRVPQAVQEELRKESTSMAPAERDRLRRLMGSTILFSYGETDDASDRYSFEIKDPTVPELGELLRLRRMPEAVQQALGTLPSRQRDVLQRRYGLAGERPQTLEEIGVQLNLSRERIRQIEQDAIRTMRKSHGLWEVYEDLGQAQVTVAETHN
jgi:RNA polymerase sigma factor (sigma-70 family)